MNKRGYIKIKSQVSVFVILAIVLVVAGGLTFYATRQNSGNAYFNSPEIKPQFNNLIESINDCLKYTTMDALEFIGFQGGYYKTPKEYFDLGWIVIPYYYKEGQFLMPSNIEIQNQLSLYIDDNLNSCFDNVKVSDFELSYLKPETETTISNGEVSFNIDMPITIKKDKKTTKLELKDSSVKQPSKLFEMLEVSRFITDSHKEDPEMICVSCVADMARDRNLYVDMLDFEENTTTLIVISQNSTGSYPMVFEFLNKYKE